MNQEKVRNACRKAHERRMSFKREVASHYGGKCGCCGETIIDFLQIHHSRLDGQEHRDKERLNSASARLMREHLKKEGSPPERIERFVQSFATPTSIWRWVKENNYPQDLGLVLLCANCHLYAHNELLLCPHKRRNKERLAEEADKELNSPQKDTPSPD